MRVCSLIAFLTLLLTSGPLPGHSQLLETLKGQAENKGENHVEGPGGSFRCVWHGLRCIERARHRGAEVAPADKEGDVRTDEAVEPISTPTEAEAPMGGRNAQGFTEAHWGQPAGTGVGRIEAVIDGVTRVYEVREGPVDEGFSTGYNVQIRGGAKLAGATIHGRHADSNTELVVSVGIWIETGQHMCDPFANQVRYSSSDDRTIRGRLRRDGAPSETCPIPPDGGRGGLPVHINVVEATFHEQNGTLRVVGDFSGPLGRGDQAPRVDEAHFEATLRPFEDLSGSPNP